MANATKGKAAHPEIVIKSTFDLVPYDKNSRHHSEAHVEQIAASIKEFGFQNPILITDTNGVLAGHGRLLAAKHLGLATVPCVVLSGLTKQQQRAYIIADNKIALNSIWDNSNLTFEISDLMNSGFNVDVLGFSEDELDSLLSLKDLTLLDPEGDPDGCPEPLSEPVTVLGDLYEIGPHRLLCGDSTVITDVERLMGDDSPNLMVTDPPYGVEYDANWRNETERPNGKSYGASALGKVSNDEKADWRDAYSLFKGNICYVWHAGKFSGLVQESIEACGFTIRCQIIWAKSNFAISRGDYHWKHEPCWYAVKNKGDWTGDRSQTTLWQIDKPMKSDTGHSTQKPIDCMAIPMKNHGKKGDSVYDPFLGSGTTMVAAQLNQRKCFGLELDPKYCDVIVTRMQQLFPTLEVKLNGEPFNGNKKEATGKKKSRTAACSA